MNSQFEMVGNFRMFEIDPTWHKVNKPMIILPEHIKEGSVVQVVFKRNLITDGGLKALACLLAGGLGVHDINGNGYGPTNFNNLRITEMRLTDAVGPAAPAPADTALSAATVYEFHDTYPTGGNNILTSEQLVTAGEVRFSGLIQQHELGGTVITEEGVFSASGELIARTTPNYTKTVDVAVQVEHTFSLSRA